MGYVNLITDPSFEHDSLTFAPGTWTTVQENSAPAAATFAVQNGWSSNGSQSLRVTTGNHTVSAMKLDALPAAITVAAGAVYSYSAVMNALALPNGFAVTLGIQWYNGGSYISDSDAASAGTTGVQTLTVANATAPAGSTQCKPIFYINGGTGTADLYLDSVIFVQAPNLPVYFDGDTPNCNWTGTAGASTSYQNTGTGLPLGPPSRMPLGA